jgi:hypothetical protein
LIVKPVENERPDSNPLPAEIGEQDFAEQARPLRLVITRRRQNLKHVFCRSLAIPCSGGEDHQHRPHTQQIDRPQPFAFHFLRNCFFEFRDRLDQLVPICPPLSRGLNSRQQIAALGNRHRRWRLLKLKAALDRPFRIGGFVSQIERKSWR